LGAAKVSITLVLNSSLTGDWGDLTSELLRVFAGALTGAWYLPLAAVILATQDRYRTAREVVYAKRLSNSATSTGLGMKDPAEIKLTDMLAQLRHTIDAHGDQPEALAKSLTTMLDQQIRPFSRDLWSKSGRRINDRSALELVRLVVSRTTYWPSLTTLAIMAVGAPLIISTTGWLEGIGRLLILGFCALGALSVLHRAQPGGAPVGVVILAVTAISFGGVNEAIAYLLFGQFGDFTALIDIALNTGLFATLSILLGILRFTRDDLRELEREMNDVFDDDYFAGRLDRERLRARQRELAHLIHGRLQNHILGAVLALTKNPQSSDPHDLVEEIERLQQELSSPDNISPRDTTKGIAEELASLATRWHGIIDVTMSPDLPETMGFEEIRACVTVAEEAVTNAVRHGLASSAEITLHQEIGHWVLAVSDNGVGPRNGPPGLGTLTLTHIAGKAWSLTAKPSGIGSLLTARIPAQPAP
jgi:two-component sensor histidine kinase